MDAGPGPQRSTTPPVEPVRGSLERFAQVLCAEVRLLMAEVHGLQRDVRVLMTDLRARCDALTFRMEIVENRLAEIEGREPPADPPSPARRCGRRPRRGGPRAGGTCRSRPTEPDR